MLFEIGITQTVNIMYTEYMKQKRPKIDPELQRPLQDYANHHYNGNVTRAVNELIREKVFKEGKSNEKDTDD